MKNDFYFLFIICFLLCLTSGFFWTPADAGNSANVAISGQIPLEYYSVSATGIGANTANITWRTNGNSTSIVEYGTPGYGPPKTNETLAFSHLVKLDGLTQHTEYHYRITSVMSDGQSTTSSDAKFTTTYPNGYEFTFTPAGTTVSGVSTATTTSGAQQVNLSLSTITPSNQDATTVTIKPAASTGWDTIKYTGDKVAPDPNTNTLSIDNIKTVEMVTIPVTTNLGGDIGDASAKIDLTLTELVTGVSVEQKIIQGATTETANAFQLAAASNNLDIKSVAYTVEFTNTEDLNAKKSGAVTLTLGVDDAWVQANGGTGSIKIFRFAKDGVKEPLSTKYTTKVDSTDYFEATSPNGLSVFGMTAVASTSSGGGGNGGGSSGGSGSTSTSTVSHSESSSYTGVSGARSTIQQAVAPIVEQITEFLAPFQEDEATTVQSITVAGLTATTDPTGTQTIHLDTALARQSGATITLVNNVITISQPGFTLSVVTRDSSVIEKGVISGTVQSIGLRTDPVSAQTGSGMVSISLDTALDGIPENAVITTTISDTANPDMLNAFQSAALANNQQVEDVAYSVVLGKTNFATTGPATLTLTVSPEWVSSHGGIPSIGVAHLSDDGTSEILTTGYTGVDNNGNIAFLTTSPKGLSAFGLVSLKTQAGPAPTTGAQQPAQAAHDTPAGTLGRFIADNIVLLAGIFTMLLAIGVAIVLYDRRSGNGNRTRKKER